jgi:hypothetical protein
MPDHAISPIQVVLVCGSVDGAILFTGMSPGSVLYQDSLGPDFDIVHSCNVRKTGNSTRF